MIPTGPHSPCQSHSKPAASHAGAFEQGAASSRSGRAPIRPYRARASAKMRIRIMPTNSFGCCAFALQVASNVNPSLG